MALSKDQLKAMVGMIAGTRDDELSCDDCLGGLAQFAETELAGREYCAAMRAVREHLDFCPECKEEYDALAAAIAELCDE